MSWSWKKLVKFILLVMLSSSICSFQDNFFEDSTHQNLAENTIAYRLPKNIIPQKYFIRLTPFIASNNLTFDGVVRIVANVKEKTSKIVLHVDRLQIRNISVRSLENKTAASKLVIKNITLQEKYQFLNIQMNSTMDTNSSINIEISYTGRLNENMNGFFRNPYRYENQTRLIVATQLEATSARNVFPCFDEPALKAVFQVIVVVPQNYTAISNMPVRSITRQRIFEFENTPIMSTYLLAIVVSDFHNLTLNEKSRTYSVWTQSQLVKQLPYSLATMSKTVDFFETRLAVPYSLAKVDMFAMPDFPGGAMENWGLLVSSEKYMLYDQNITSLAMKRSIRNLIAHEVAHQWFGNLVTPKWWDYIWLNEGFAQYFEYHAHEDEVSSWRLESQFVVDIMHEALSVDVEEDAHPVTHKVYSPSQIGAMFDSISYNKAASLIRMLEKVVGPKIFYGALGTYMQNNQYSTTVPELLYTAFEQEISLNDFQLNASVAEIMDNWTLQPGYPVVNVNFIGDIVTMKQTRFALQPLHQIDNHSTWIVPLNWATQSKPHFNSTGNLVWLRNKSASFTIKNASKDWVIFNLQQAGFYRVNYDNDMWKRIIDTLKSDRYEVIHEINRAALIDDLFNLARVGLVEYHVVLDAVRYLDKETSYIVWKAASSGFTDLKIRFMSHSTPYNHLKTYMVSLLEPHYNRLGFYEKRSESYFDTLLRELVLTWLCTLEHEDCILQSWITFESFRKNETSAISTNQQSIVYCTVIKHGSLEEWNFLWRKYKESLNSIEKFTILSALTCSQNATKLRKLLRGVVTLAHGIKLEEVHKLMILLARNSVIGLHTFFNYLENNFDEMIQYNENGKFLFSIIKSVSKMFTTNETVKKFDNFVKRRYKEIPNIAQSLQYLLDSVIYEYNWFEKYSSRILSCLKNNTSMLSD